MIVLEVCDSIFYLKHVQSGRAGQQVYQNVFISIDLL